MTKYTPEQKIKAFWSKVAITANDDLCWEWQGGLRDGYGLTGVNKRAHRIAWELTYGKIPDGLFICHSCDNRACCNPKHLFLGTNKDNVDDMVNKGRQVKGERNGQHKITLLEVLEIRKRYKAGGVTQKQLAIEYGIGRIQVCRIVNNKRWR